jgi:Sulfotransferase family
MKQTLKLWRNRIVVSIFRKILKTKKNRADEGIILCSEPRGGSTWLMEIFAKIPGSIINWEPLDADSGVVPKEFKWGEMPNIPENDNTEEYAQLMNHILTMKKISTWTLKFCSFNSLIMGKQVITKCVRANQLIPWMINHFNFRYKPVYLLRHPIPVCISQIKNFLPGARLEPFQVPDWINNDAYKKHSGYLNSMETLLQRQIALWCLRNSGIINHPHAGEKWIVVYYEDLVSDPENEVSKLFKKLSLDTPKKLGQFRKPSKSTNLNDFKEEPMEQLSKWKEDVNADELAKIEHIFNYFEIKIYSAYNIYPLKAGHSKLITN